MKRFNGLSKQSFRRWLESQEPNASVGHVGGLDNCPLATYIQKELHTSAQVTSLFINTEDTTYRQPLWTSRFVRLVDGGDLGASVTAKQALDYLRQV